MGDKWGAGVVQITAIGFCNLFFPIPQTWLPLQPDGTRGSELQGVSRGPEKGRKEQGDLEGGDRETG